MIVTVENSLECLKVTLSDGTVQYVPNDTLNADYVRVQEWVAAGGTITS